MAASFEDWLRTRGYDGRTISSRVSGIRRVERHHGNLDAHFRRDGLADLLRKLRYSTIDESHGRPNPSRIPIQGVLRTNLASYRTAVSLYRDYLWSGGVGGDIVSLERSPLQRHSTPKLAMDDPRTLSDFELNGFAALEALIGGSRYSTIAQAIASLTLFSHPDTVRQTGGRAVFFAIRDPKRVGQIAEVGGRRIALDDNKSPTDAFLWANGIPRRGRDTQFNQIYAASNDVESHTALPNICMTLAFMAKLTDTSSDISKLLKFRSFDLYGWHPATAAAPERPEDCDALEWAPTLPPIPDVRRAIDVAMARKPKSRTVKAARELGWLFGDGRPTP